MHTKIKKNLAKPFLAGSLVVTIGSTIGNLFNYLFHASMGRILPPGDYGTLTTLISFATIFGIFALTISTVISKFISTYKAHKKQENITYLLRMMIKRVFLIMIFGVGLLQILIPFLQSFLHVEDAFLLNIAFIGSFLALLIAVNTGALQGLLMFNLMALFSTSGSLLRFLLALLLVYLGYGLKGATVGFFFAYFLPYLLTFIPLKKYIFYKQTFDKIPFKEILAYSLPTLGALLGLSMFISIDVILVKHFFSGVDVGYYAALSVIGRVIYFATSSIGLVMFPIIAVKYAKGENYNKTFIFSLTAVLFASLIITTFYFLFPKFMIKLFYSKEIYYQEAKNLGLMGIFFSLYSIANLFSSFFLSISKVKIVLISILASCFQALLILNFHSNLREVIIASITAVSFLTAVFMIYYLYNAFKQK